MFNPILQAAYRDPARQTYIPIKPPTAGDISKISIYRAQRTTSKMPIIFQLPFPPEWLIRNLEIKAKGARVGSESLMRWLQRQWKGLQWKMNQNSLLMVDIDGSVLPHALPLTASRGM
jgi:hypothetical protein